MLAERAPQKASFDARVEVAPSIPPRGERGKGKKQKSCARWACAGENLMLAA